MTADARKAEALRSIKFFTSLNDETLQLLGSRLVPDSYGEGQCLCNEGEPGDQLFIIKTGRVAVLKGGNGGAPVKVAVLEPGQIAGELSLLGKPIRSATLQAETETNVWTLDHASFQELLEQHPGLARELLSRLTVQLQRESSLLARVLTRDVDPRPRIAFFDAKPYMQRAFETENKDRFAIQFLEPRLSRETVSLAAGANAVCVFVNDRIDREVIEELRSLGVGLVALRCAGFNNVDLAACQAADIDVVRVPAYSPHAVAEHAIALMMALNRKIHRAHNRVREGNFSLNGLVGFDMYGKTAGVVGTGKIGASVVRILRGFGCRVLGYDPFENQDLAKETGMTYVSLPELMTQADIISLHVPLFPETHHLINAQAVKLMKPGVMLINTSRGGLINTPALIDGLKCEKIGAAGLDVYEEEAAYFFEDYSDTVLTDDVLARLTTFNNVIISSHQGFLTEEALAAIAQTTLTNVSAFANGVRGETLPNVVKGG